MCFNFESVFNPIIILWREEYPIIKSDSRNSFIKSLKHNYTEIDSFLDQNIIPGEWNQVINFIIYQVFTEYALSSLKDCYTSVYNPTLIPVGVFEKQLRDNFSIYRDREFDQNYKGFEDKTNAELLLIGYLLKYRLELK